MVDELTNNEPIIKKIAIDEQEKKLRSENIRGLLYILIRNLYIDREPYTIEKKPNLVRLAERKVKNA